MIPAFKFSLISFIFSLKFTQESISFSLGLMIFASFVLFCLVSRFFLQHFPQLLKRSTSQLYLSE